MDSAGRISPPSKAWRLKEMILEMRAVRSAGGQFGPDLSCEPNGFSGGQSSAVTHMDVCV